MRSAVLLSQGLLPAWFRTLDSLSLITTHSSIAAFRHGGNCPQVSKRHRHSTGPKPLQGGASQRDWSLFLQAQPILRLCVVHSLGWTARTLDRVSVTRRSKCPAWPASQPSSTPELVPVFSAFPIPARLLPDHRAIAAAAFRNRRWFRPQTSCIHENHRQCAVRRPASRRSE